MFTLRDKRIVVTGGGGFLGGAVCEELKRRGVTDPVIPRSADHDLRIPSECAAVVAGADAVIHCAAFVGGIALNAEKPVEMFNDNAAMGTNLLEAARAAGVRKMVIIGTACSYPKDAPMPLREETLWDGEPDPVTGPYGLAKRLLFAEATTYRERYGFDAICLIPTNLYGPGDHFDPKHGHVIPSLIRRMAEAKERNAPSFDVWGTGKATREFLFIRDAARGIVDALERYDSSDPVNLGTGIETPIRDLVELLKETIGYEGAIEWDASKPEGNMRRCMDTARAKKAFGFEAATTLKDGLRETVDWYLRNR